MNATVAKYKGLNGHGDRVREHTAPVVNRRIDRLTAASIEETVGEGREAIARRVAELDDEWDIDRAMMANFAIAGGAAFAAGLYRFSKKPLFGPRPKGLLVFFGAQLGFLLLHAVAGWCPPASLFRRLGVRTKAEIDNEKSILLRTLEQGSAT
jgi:hypothetical protein